MKTFVLKNELANVICRLVIEKDNLFLYTPSGNYCSEPTRSQFGHAKLFFVVFHENPNIHIWYYIDRDLSDRLCCGLVYNGKHCLPTKKSKALFLKTIKEIPNIEIFKR
jgi:hypothetical protein